MNVPRLYKYLDAKGELKMLKHGNLQFTNIGDECFESLYLGINIDEEKKVEIIKAALTLNPNIKIYQMEIDPKAFRLKEKQI